MSDYTEITEKSKSIMRDNIKDSPLREQRYGLIPKGKALIGTTELEELRAKGAAFDFMSKHECAYYNYVLVGDGDPSIGGSEYIEIVFPQDKKSHRGQTLLEAVNNAMGDKSD